MQATHGHQWKVRWWYGLAVLAALLTAAVVVQAATYMVDNLAEGSSGDTIRCEAFDLGDCTLFDAIELANLNPGPDTVTFNLPGPMPTTIKYGGWQVNDTVFIDGRTQPGFGIADPCRPVITIDANAMGTIFTLEDDASDSTIRGLALINGTSAQIRLDRVDDVTIVGNWIGVNATDATVGWNNGDGVFALGGSGHTIGGAGCDRNVVSGTQDGIEIEYDFQTLQNGGNHAILGNYIGSGPDGSDPTDPVGTSYGNSDDGIDIGGSSCSGIGEPTGIRVGDGTAGGRNIVVNNNIGIRGSSNNANEVLGNWIGRNLDGTPGSNGYGVFLTNVYQWYLADNQIAFNDQDGVYIDGVFGGCSEVVFERNDIHNNGDAGIHTVEEDSIIIGGPDPSQGNLIHDNFGSGIWFEALGFSFGDGGHVVMHNEIWNNWKGIEMLRSNYNTLAHNDVHHNFYGITLESDTGWSQLWDNDVHHNDCSGIYLTGFADGHIIGIFDPPTFTETGTGQFFQDSHAAAKVMAAWDAADDLYFAGGLGNHIFQNGLACEQTGINLLGGSAVSMRGNSIHDNVGVSGLGIDLDGDGVTFNDGPGDFDGGANDDANFPYILSATVTEDEYGVSASASGFLASVPNSNFTIDLYGNDACDPSGFGEGKRHVGSVKVFTGPTGNVSWSTSIAPPGPYLTATSTAIDIWRGADTGATPGDTSEFSRCKSVTYRSYVPPGTSTQTQTTTTTTSSTTSSTTTTSSSTTSSPTSTSATGGPGTSTGGVQPVHKIQFTGEDGRPINPLGGLRGIINARFEPAPDSDLNPDDVCVYIVDRDGNRVLETGPGGGVLDTNVLGSEWYTAEARLCAQSQSQSAGGFRILQSDTLLLKQPVLVMHPLASLETTAASVATGIGVIGAMALIANTIVSRGGMIVGTATKEAMIAVGEDRLRSRAIQQAMGGKAAGGATAGASAKVGALGKAWIAFILSVILLGIFFALEGAEALNLGEFLAVLPIIGACATFFFAGQFSFEYLAARVSGTTARFRFLWPGAISLALSTLIFRVAFGYPGYVDEDDDEDNRVIRGMKGVRALGVFGAMLAVSALFVPAGRYFDYAFFEEGLGVAMVAISTASLPFAPLPGADVWKWRPFVSLGTIAGSLFLFFGYTLALIPPYMYIVMGLIGFGYYLVVLYWLRLRLEQPAPAWYAAIDRAHDNVMSRLDRMKPAAVKRFKAARVRFYGRVTTAMLRASDRIALAVINGWRRVRGKPPLVPVELPPEPPRGQA